MANSDFAQPPRTMNSEGKTRRVGFEFEYTGLDLAQSAEIVRSIFGGTVKGVNKFCFKVEDTELGTFQLESDASMLKDRSYDKYLDMVGISQTGKVRDKLDDVIASVASDVVPYEIVTPPVSITDLQKVEDLRLALHLAGAEGTFAHVYAAYGMQFNPEMPAFDVETFLAFKRAFFLLLDQLKAREEVPIARRLLPFINDFPNQYIAQVLDPKYRPDLNTFMVDYLKSNPTRNRPLDWLPLFTWLDKELVFSFEVERKLIKPRPTLHYRLPSCLIDDPNWTIAGEWNKWVEIERLANDPSRIEKMSLEWMEMVGKHESAQNSDWIKRSTEWMSASI